MKEFYHRHHHHHSITHHFPKLPSTHAGLQGLVPTASLQPWVFSCSHWTFFCVCFRWPRSCQLWEEWPGWWARPSRGGRHSWCARSPRPSWPSWFLRASVLHHAGWPASLQQRASLVRGLVLLGCLHKPPLAKALGGQTPPEAGARDNSVLPSTLLQKSYLTIRFWSMVLFNKSSFLFLGEETAESLVKNKQNLPLNAFIILFPGSWTLACYTYVTLRAPVPINRNNCLVYLSCSSYFHL